MVGKRLVYGWNGLEPFVSEEHPMMTTEGWGAFNPTTLYASEFKTFDEVVKEELKDLVENYAKLNRRTRIRSNGYSRCSRRHSSLCNGGYATR